MNEERQKIRVSSRSTRFKDGDCRKNQEGRRKKKKKKTVGDRRGKKKKERGNRGRGRLPFPRVARLDMDAWPGTDPRPIKGAQPARAAWTRSLVGAQPTTVGLVRSDWVELFLCNSSVLTPILAPFSPVFLFFSNVYII